MQTKLIRKFVFGASCLVATLALSSARVEHHDNRLPTLTIATAHAEPDDPGAMKKLCGLLGVTDAVVSESPKSCGWKAPGDLTPGATICSTTGGDNVATGGFRTCEVCVAADAEKPCSASIKAKAEIKTGFNITVKGFKIKCKANASFEATGESEVTWKKTTWNPLKGPGSDKAIDYYGEVMNVSASSAAKVQLGGDCEVTPPVPVGGGGGEAELKIECEISTKGKVFAQVKKRDARSCDQKPDATVVDEPVTDASTDAPTPTTDASTPDATTADATKVDKVETMADVVKLK